MKKVNLADISDVYTLSWVLDRAIFLLGNSPAQLRLSELSRAVGLHASVLTRIKLLHNNPQYEPFVNQHTLYRVLQYLFEQFPTLVLRQNRDGQIHVYLYKKYAGEKLGSLNPDNGNGQIFKRNVPKPGSTRWFLENLDRENISPERRMG